MFTINASTAYSQATCTLPVTGPFFENTAGGFLTLAQMKTNGLCYTIPTGPAGTFQTVCYRYTYPTSGTVTMNYGIEWSSGGCNNNSCTAGYQTTYNAGCLTSPVCSPGGAGPVVTTYDASCGFVMNNGGIGSGCGAGAFVPGNDYIMCFKVPLDPTCSVTVCPVIACSSGDCGCPATVTAAAGTDQILCGVTSTTLTGNNASPGTGTWTLTSGPNSPTITSPNSASTTVTGLISGTYIFRWTSVCATHSGFDEVTVTVNPNLVPSISSNVPVTCTGSGNGSLTVTTTGGGAPFTYAWSPSGGTGASATGLSGGTYTVTVAGGGCTKTVSATVQQSSTLLAPSISSNTPVSCTGGATGSLTASQTGGTGPFTYSWSPGGATTATISGLTVGTYSVTITDAYGCIKTTSGTITQPASAIGSSISSQSNVGCTGTATGSATVTGTGGTPGYTYSWSPGGQTTASVSGLTAGTYSVMVTDSKGCTKQQSVAITQPASSLGSTISGQSNVNCTGSATGSATVTGTGGTPAYTYSWSPGGQTTASVTGLTAGTYSVTVTDANGCTKQQSVAITQPASSLGSTISGQSNVNCTGSATGSATVTGTGGTPAYTYSWSPGGQTTASVTGLTAGTYSVTVTDANGCTKQQSVAITQPASSLGSTISGQSNVNCTGSATGSATVTGTGGTPTYTYSWSPGGQTTASVTGLTAGTYSVMVTDANGCTKQQSVAITQPASSLGSTISGQSNVNCTGSATGSATVTGTGGTPTYTYIWSPGGNTTNSVSGLTAGTYSVTITDANGCTAIQTIAITQPASNVNSTTVSVNATCGNSNGTASVTATGGTPGYTYNWSPSGGTNSTATNLPAGPYTVTITDNNGCTKTDAVTVNNSAAPTIGISSQTDVLCNGSGTGSATVTAIGGTGTLTYLWSPGGQTTSTVGGLTAGTYTVTVTDSNSCSQVQLITITQPASAISSGISSQNNVGCTGSSTGSATVTATGGTGAYTYNWNTGATTDTISGLSAGTYSVTVTDANGCSQLQQVIITEPTSTVTVTSSTVNASCGSSDGSISTTVSGGTPGYTYNWSTGGTTPSITGLIAGTYSVTISDLNGCTQTTQVTISGLPGPSITGTPTTNVTCNGLSNGTASVSATNGTLPYTYTWKPNVTTNSFVTGLSANTYTVIVTDVAGCADTTLITITQPPPLLFTIISSNLNICAGESLTLTTTTPTGGTAPFTFNWLPNGPVVNPTVPTTYSVTVTDASGCISQMDTIRVVPLPSPTAGFDTLSSGLFHEKYTFTDKSTGGDSWYWDFGDGTTSILESPFHIFKAGTYTVTQVVKNSTSGCTDTLTTVVVIRPNILIPNTFSPNHDGINDDFWIPNTGFESFTLEIFNRWGTKLFETDEGEIRWDGRTSAGVEVSDGTYYFILKAVLKDDKGGKNYSTHGFIDLFRGGGK